MDNRFRREENISRQPVKKPEKDKKHIPEHHTQGKKADESFVSHFMESYKKATKNHVLRDTALLTIVLFCALFSISLALPRIFSIHFDASSIFSIFNQSESVSPSTEENTGDMDILILGR